LEPDEVVKVGGLFARATDNEGESLHEPKIWQRGDQNVAEGNRLMPEARASFTV
jgi:hypothetical protein